MRIRYCTLGDWEIGELNLTGNSLGYEVLVTVMHKGFDCTLLGIVTVPKNRPKICISTSNGG